MGINVLDILDMRSSSSKVYFMVLENKTLMVLGGDLGKDLKRSDLFGNSFLKVMTAT